VLAIAFLMSATQLDAAARGGTLPRATTVGLLLTKFNDRLVVIDAAKHTGLTAWDHIVAVNGRRVSTETAFMSRLLSANAPATILVNRSGYRLTVNLAAGAGSGAVHRAGAVASKSSSGWMNPGQMVRTSQGVMHIERARILGLPGVPIEGSPPGPPFPPKPIPAQAGWMNPAQMVRTSQGVMHIERARILGLPGVPIEGSPPGPPFPPKPIPAQAGWMNPAQMVRTSQGVMHIERARLLGLPGVPIEGTPPRPFPK
jgi:ribosomal protein S8